MLKDSIASLTEPLSVIKFLANRGNLPDVIPSMSLRIPTIGIGAGSDCDGQVLVSYDMLGITSGRLPRFVRNFMTGKDSAREAIESFNEEVKAGTYPSIDETY